MNIRYRTEYSLCQRCVNFWALRDNDKIAQFTWIDVLPGSYSEPTAQLTDTQAQELMDQLWCCGFRPTEGRGSAGALAATQQHLEDFRALISVKLNVNLP